MTEPNYKDVLETLESWLVEERRKLDDLIDKSPTDSGECKGYHSYKAAHYGALTKLRELRSLLVEQSEWEPCGDKLFYESTGGFLRCDCGQDVEVYADIYLHKCDCGQEYREEFNVYRKRSTEGPKP